MADGTLFLERIIRVDLVGFRKNDEAGSSDTDRKHSVFVGNLDFASKEEFFSEGLTTSSRCLPPPSNEIRMYLIAGGL